METKPTSIYLKDYTPPDFLIPRIYLQVDIFEDHTLVTGKLEVRANPERPSKEDLVLQGLDMELMSIEMDGRLLGDADFRLGPEDLTIYHVPPRCVITTVVKIKPHLNTACEGLYRSRNLFSTQCEAQGFRKITYFQDRPDVLSIYNVTISAPKEFPVLLSNGNPVENGQDKSGRHWATWHDPFPKPSYLFALVAGDLEYIKDSFKTMTGRLVTLKIYAEAKDLKKLEHAMDSLKRSMAWDEKVYGREYDLDLFMIVAVDDFNMGAMENKGLNIFNTSAVLASSETTTDEQFQGVEATVAHEYFHNWSGNRVTCRDWFQLSLKEGFTVFRDQSFSADMGSPTVNRIDEVSGLRVHQFAEDSGPLAHAVRPESYMEISNFYTSTIYEKGAELIRMMSLLLGPELFRKGTDLYFTRHDGQAVTTEDFVAALEEVSGRDLKQFSRWYQRPGTPRLNFTDEYDPSQGLYRLTVTQEQEPFHFPLAVGLIGSTEELVSTRILEVTQKSQTFEFSGVKEKPIPSLMRGFSAPVKWTYDFKPQDLLGLMSRDTDGFSRWDAAQTMGILVLGDGARADLSESLIEAYGKILNDRSLDLALGAMLISPPSLGYLTELAKVIDVHEIWERRRTFRLLVAKTLAPKLKEIYLSYDHTIPHQINGAAIARRRLKNTALRYLIDLNDPQIISQAYEQYKIANNLSDRIYALDSLLNCSDTQAQIWAQEALDDFYHKWKDDTLMMNRWLSIQAVCLRDGTLDRVLELEKHPIYDFRNPNKIRSLVGAFCSGNPLQFHDPAGRGYTYLADRILTLDEQNPQVAARLLGPLTSWRRYKLDQGSKMKDQLERMLGKPGLSKDLYEKVSLSLGKA